MFEMCRYFILTEWKSPYLFREFYEELSRALSCADYKSEYIIEEDLHLVTIKNTAIENTDQTIMTFFYSFEKEVESLIQYTHSVMDARFYGNGKPNIEETIVFAPENKAAGVSILSFFSEVIETEFADRDVKFGITQNGNTVTLRIETPEGELLKEVEQALNQYCLAVVNKAPLESVSKYKELIQELKTRLEVTQLELRLRQEHALEKSKNYESRIENLETQLFRLHEQLSEHFHQSSNLIDTIRTLSRATQPSDAFLTAIKEIAHINKLEHSKEAECSLQHNLKVIEKESPGLISRLASTIESIPASIAANFASPWVQSIINSIPK